MKLIFSTLLSLGILSINSVSAQETTETKADNEATEVIIIKQLTRSDRVKSITSSDLKLSSSLTLPQALGGVTGTHIIRNGGPGQPASLSMRGSSADEIVVLFDGVRLNDPSLVGGGVNLGLISPSGASRIDILSGPAGAQWGSGATGGVILIQPMAETNGFNLEGGEDHHLTSLSLAPKWGKVQSVIHLSNANDAASSAASNGTEIDKFTHSQVYLRLGASKNEALDWRVWVLSANSLSHYDGFPAPNYILSDTDDYGTLSNLGVGASMANEFSLGRLSIKTHLYKSQRQTFSEGQAGFSSEGKIAESELTLAPRGKNQDWLIGLTYQSDEMITLSPDYSGGFIRADANQSRWGLFAIGSHKLTSKTMVSGALRSESTDHSTDHNTHLSLNYNLDARSQAGLSISTGHKRPSLFQRFSEYSKPDLRPESSLMTEAYWRYRTKKIRLDLGLYERRSDDLIVFATCFGITTALCSSRPFGHYDNLNKAKHRGYDIELTHLSKLGHLKLSHNSLKAKQLAGLNQGKDLPRTPRSISALSYDYSLTSLLKINLKAKYVGPAYDDAAGLTALKGFNDISFGAIFSPKGPTEWVLRGENLTKSKQITAYGYSGPVRRFTVGVRLKL